MGHGPSQTRSSTRDNDRSTLIAALFEHEILNVHGFLILEL